MIRLVAHADTLMELLEEIRARAKFVGLEVPIAELNRMIEDVNSPEQVKTLLAVRQALMAIYNLTDTLPISQQLRDDLAEERIHFKKHRKANEYRARYMRVKRDVRTDKNKSANFAGMFDEIPSPAGASRPDGASASTSKSETDAKDFDRAIGEINRRHWPEGAPTIAEINQMDETSPDRDVI